MSKVAGEGNSLHVINWTISLIVCTMKISLARHTYLLHT